METDKALLMVIADSAVITRSGLAAVVKRVPNMKIHPVEVASPEMLHSYLQLHTPDIVVVNPMFGGWFDLAAFKAEHREGNMKYVALVCSVMGDNLLKEYDECFTICDDTDTISSKINRLLHTEEEEDRENGQEVLSQREKEIVTCVVKGMTNKAIADELFISIHTVITHRRNIARKLQIHSPAGLTIYAIVNKLVELQDIGDIL